MIRSIFTRNGKRWQGLVFACGLILPLLTAAQGHGQAGEVTLRVIFASSAHSPRGQNVLYPVVAWLTPLGIDSGSAPPVPVRNYQMVQRNKMFDPHLLVLTVGSVVVFPNRDPFFHNVFSLFNGKRFDLGLYEAGDERRVRFDREGVSYIFCNIHPEMGAVILSLSTPYYAVSREDAIAIDKVPAGKYMLSLWSEGATQESLAAARREVTVTAQETSLGSIFLVASSSPITHHANKFGEAYPAASSPYSVY